MATEIVQTDSADLQIARTTCGCGCGTGCGCGCGCSGGESTAKAKDVR